MILVTASGVLRIAAFIGGLIWLVVHLAFITGSRTAWRRTAEAHPVPRAWPASAGYHTAAGARLGGLLFEAHFEKEGVR